MNPYNFRIWWEVWQQISDQNLRWTVHEWMPAFFFPEHFILWIYITFSCILTFRYRTHFSFIEKWLYGILLIAGLSSFRMLPFWIILSVLMICKASVLFYQEVKQYRYGLERLSRLNRVFIGASMILLLTQAYLDIQSTRLFTEKAFYPIKAVIYLNQTYKKGNIFSIYDWGGYLDWKLPEKKVFIDGRMPSWRWKAPHPQESSYAYKDYQQMLVDRTSLSANIKKYHITSFLFPQGMFVDTKNSIPVKLDNYVFRKKLMLNLPEEITTMGFKKVYSDSLSIIYRK